MKTHTYYSQLHIKDAVVLRPSQKSDPFFFSAAAASCLSDIANNSFEVTDEKKIVRRKRKPGSDKRCTKAQTAKDTKDSCGQNRKTRKKKLNGDKNRSD